LLKKLTLNSLNGPNRLAGSDQREGDYLSFSGGAGPWGARTFFVGGLDFAARQDGRVAVRAAFAFSKAALRLIRFPSF
jgi:hypothetical protein